MIGFKITKDNFTNVLKSFYNIGQSLPHNDTTECNADEIINPYLKNNGVLRPKELDLSTERNNLK
jgi:hypothetical protein